MDILKLKNEDGSLFTTTDRNGTWFYEFKDGLVTASTGSIGGSTIIPSEGNYDLDLFEEQLSEFFETPVSFFISNDSREILDREVAFVESVQFRFIYIDTESQSEYLVGSGDNDFVMFISEGELCDWDNVEAKNDGVEEVEKFGFPDGHGEYKWRKAFRQKNSDVLSPVTADDMEKHFSYRYEDVIK